MRQTNRHTADTVLNIARKAHGALNNAATCCHRRFGTKNSEHHFDKFAADSVRKRPSSVEDVIAIRSPSGKYYFRCDARRAPEKRRGKTALGGGKAGTRS